MRFERMRIETGEIREEATPPSFTYRWTNAGERPLVITRVETTCGCAVASYDRRPVLPGGEGSVTVTYHPKRHPGYFRRRIFVFTQLSEKLPHGNSRTDRAGYPRSAADRGLSLRDERPAAQAAGGAHRRRPPADRAHRVPECRHGAAADHGRQSAAPCPASASRATRSSWSREQRATWSSASTPRNGRGRCPNSSPSSCRASVCPAAEHPVHPLRRVALTHPPTRI